MGRLTNFVEFTFYFNFRRNLFNLYIHYRFDDKVFIFTSFRSPAFPLVILARDVNSKRRGLTVLALKVFLVQICEKLLALITMTRRFFVFIVNFDEKVAHSGTKYEIVGKTTYANVKIVQLSHPGKKF